MFLGNIIILEKVPSTLSVTISSSSNRTIFPLLAVAVSTIVTPVAGDLSARNALP